MLGVNDPSYNQNKHRIIEGDFEMPAYEYLCDACESRFEKRQKMSEAPLESCPQCGGAVRRLISGGAGAITKSSSGQFSDGQAARGTCASGGPCCGGQGAACNNKMFCEN
jgi:putative FmdB family regulatory protein